MSCLLYCWSSAYTMIDKCVHIKSNEAHKREEEEKDKINYNSNNNDKQMCIFYDKHLAYAIDLKSPKKRKNHVAALFSSLHLVYFILCRVQMKTFVCFITKKLTFLYMWAFIRCAYLTSPIYCCCCIMAAATAVERSSTSWHAFIFTELNGKKEREREIGEKNLYARISILACYCLNTSHFNLFACSYFQFILKYEFNVASAHPSEPQIYF